MESGGGLSGHLFHHRGLVQNVQHPPGGGKGALEGGAQVGQSYHRAKGGHEGNEGNEHPAKVYLTLFQQHQPQGQQRQVVEPDDGVGDGGVGAGDTAHVLLHPAQIVGAALQLTKTLGLAVVLDGLIHPPQAVQYKGGQLPCLLAHPVAGIPGAARGQHGEENAHGGVGQQSQHPVGPVEPGQKGGGEQAHYQGNGGRGDGVGVEHLQQLNIGGDDRDQIPLVPPVQLGRGQAAQGGKYLLAQNSQQFKGNVVVAGLLSVAEHPAQQGTQGGDQENQGQGVLVVEDGENAHAA